MTEEGVKVILVGNAAVGKTSLVNSFLELPFDKDVLSTNMASYQRKNVESSNGVQVRLDIWDTAGQEKFRAMLPIYFRAASVALLCFDNSTIDSIDDWYNTVIKATPNCDIFLVLTKNDMYDDKEERKLLQIMMQKSDELKIQNYFSTSAKENNGIDQIFKKAADVATTVISAQTEPPRLIENDKKKCC
ncbi:Ras-related protein Rab-18 [Tritrichomonas foetus]|uniref:Ras-related protein Rab-18 n=1 Tax=Tritrichomonas foetus TaxID=1144522 RepID=A0A1J4K6W7_9EUKA|nr:Ras-related protein Rab-18 [Tritrichomonas foetus]|eukprot:OHT07111.1 Ras-related protein Rab-18 [Tritrichomonas foetus]